MEIAITVAIIIVGMLLWITFLVWFVLAGITWLLNHSDKLLTIKRLEFQTVLVESIKRFWTPLLLMLFVLSTLSLFGASGSVLERLRMPLAVIGFAILVFDERMTKELRVDRIIRYVAYFALILSFIFTGVALDDEREFLDVFVPNIATELFSLAITLLFVNQLYHWRDRAYQQELDNRLAEERRLVYKEDTIRQMASQSNEFALDAVRKARNEGWLEDGSLQGAGLREANLQRAVLVRADLRHADLQGANLQKADLFRAKLQGSILVGARLQGTSFRHAEIQDSSLFGAKYDSKTIWPDGFTPPADAINVNEQLK